MRKPPKFAVAVYEQKTNADDRSSGAGDFLRELDRFTVARAHTKILTSANVQFTCAPTTQKSPHTRRNFQLCRDVKRREVATAPAARTLRVNDAFRQRRVVTKTHAGERVEARARACCTIDYVYWRAERHRTRIFARARGR